MLLNVNYVIAGGDSGEEYDIRWGRDLIVYLYDATVERMRDLSTSRALWTTRHVRVKDGMVLGMPSVRRGQSAPTATSATRTSSEFIWQLSYYRSSRRIIQANICGDLMPF